MTHRSLAIAVLVGCHAAPVDPLARFRDVTGGARWGAARFVETKVTVAVGGLTGTAESIEDVATGRHRTITHLGALVVGDGFDGTAAWELTTNGEVVTPDDPKAIALQITNRWLTRRGYFTRTGARFVEHGAHDGHYHVVEATPDGGAPIELWFDDATGLLARTKNQEGAETVTTTYADYRTVDGLQFPFSTTVDSGDPRNQVTMAVTELHVRDGIADTAFARPHTDTERLTLASSPSEIPFELINNHIYIHAAVDGKPVRMIVDTGGLDLLTPTAAAKLGLPTSGKLAVAGTGAEKADLAFARGHSLEVGGVKLADPVFYIVGMGELDNIEGEAFDGLVGFEMFQRLVVRVDYPNHKLVLAKRDGFTPPVGAIAVPFELRDRTPVASGEVDGLPARFTIDTGARNSLTLNSPFVREHELEKRYKPKFETVTGWGVGGAARGKPVRFAHVKLGGATIDNVAGELFTGDKGALADPDSSGNVGGGILRRFAVTFDYRDKVMYLEPGPVEPDVYDRAGMFFLAAGDALRVLAVTPGGPAERAGLAAGDRIIAIDGQPIAAKRLVEWRAIVAAGAVGAKHALTVDGKGPRSLVLAELLP